MFVETKRDGETDPGFKAEPKPDLGGLRVDRILALAEEIEKPTLGMIYDMSIGRCGTRACLAGHTEVMFPEEGESALGLNENQTSRLFMPDGWRHGGRYNDRARAARVLRHLAKTGEVNWSV